MNNPEYVKVKDKLYKLNTDFQVALECEKVVKSNVSDTEKSLAVLYLLYGEAGLNNQEDWQELMDKGCTFLQCGKDVADSTDEPNMDYEQDRSYIKASFYTDYGIPNVFNTEMHWWDFCDYMNGLTEDCVLNRVRYVRDYDISECKGKELEEWKKRKKEVELKKNKKEPTAKQKKSCNAFYDAMGW